jgi:hypothetical protein
MGLVGTGCGSRVRIGPRKKWFSREEIGLGRGYSPKGYIVQRLYIDPTLVVVVCEPSVSLKSSRANKNNHLPQLSCPSPQRLKLHIIIIMHSKSRSVLGRAREVRRDREHVHAQIVVYTMDMIV